MAYKAKYDHYDKQLEFVLLNGNEFRIYDVPRDDIFIQNLFKIEEKFWNLVVTKTKPEIDGSESTTELLHDVYQVNPDTITALPIESLDIIEQYNHGNDVEKQGKALKAEAKNKLLEMLGDFEVGAIGDIKVTNAVQSEVNVTKLAMKYPEIFEEFTVSKFDDTGFKKKYKQIAPEFLEITDGRRFTIKQTKEKKEKAIIK